MVLSTKFVERNGLKDNNLRLPACHILDSQGYLGWGGLLDILCLDYFKIWATVQNNFSNHFKFERPSYLIIY